MNLKIAAAILTSSLLLIACKPNSTTTQTPTPTESQSTTSTTGQLKDLLSMGKSLECTVKSTQDTVTSIGTVYLDGQRMRGDFQLTGDNPIQSSMIKQDNTLYTWGTVNGKPYGSKITIDPDTQSPETPDTTSQSIDLEQQVDYSCQPWTPQESKFELPSDIEFTDLNAQLDQLQQIQKQLPQGNGCTACDKLPADSQAECRQALNC